MFAKRLVVSMAAGKFSEHIKEPYCYIQILIPY